MFLDKIKFEVEKYPLEKYLPEADVVIYDRVENGSPRWHELRTQGIGSSDAGQIMSATSWSSPRRLWLKKTGQTKDNFQGSVNTWFGQFMEPRIRSYLSLKENTKIIDGGLIGQLSWKEWPVARANIDGLNEADGVIEEIKTSNKKWDKVPNHYYTQVQHQLLVTGAKSARVRQLIIPLDRLNIFQLYKRVHHLSTLEHNFSKVYDLAFSRWLIEYTRGDALDNIVTWDVPRDDEFIEELLDKEKKFWKHVEERTEPE